MRAVRLMAILAVYYAALVALLYLAVRLFPPLRDYLPIGGVQALITQPDKGVLQGNQIPAVKVHSLGESLAWLSIAITGAILTALPVTWVYMGIRTTEEYDQSLISTILILPLTVTSIVIVVQNSLALAFSLAGIAGAVRFKNSLKSSGDALFILVSIGIGLAAGIGAVELALVMSFAFNLCFVLLWVSEYGERTGMKRYMSDIDPTTCPPTEQPAPPAPAP